MATDYIATLQTLPEPLRRQMLRGDYDGGLQDGAFQPIPMTVQQIPEGLRSALSSLGHDLARTPAEVAEYARSLLPRLQAASSEPNPQEALVAVRGLVVAFAAGRAVDAADAVDGRLWGAVHGVLWSSMRG